MSTPAPSLNRTRADRVVAGVLGGVARRFGWNPTLVRALFVILSVVSAAFPGLFVYLLLWVLMPEGDG